ncbi:MAG: hypothetical protein SVY53_11250 [Chloroflexota bacterium]|nr:hypothetical protein [Chloroflexota bacterium]
MTNAKIGDEQIYCTDDHHITEKGDYVQKSWTKSITIGSVSDKGIRAHPR